MTTSRSGIRRRLRLGAILLGLLCLIWLPFEDQSFTLVYLFALAFSTLLAFYIYRRWQTGGPNLLKPVLCGFLAGALMTPLVLLIIAVKTGVHGNPVPADSPYMLMEVLWLTPVWLIAGGLLGTGLGLLAQ